MSDRQTGRPEHNTGFRVAAEENQSRLLAGLDDVNWSEVWHAYGPADDVPELLRAIAGPDDVTRETAITDLFGTICHQGSVYPATIPAVQFIAELAREAAMSADHRRLLIALLGAIGAGDDEDARDAVAVEFPALLARLAGSDARMDWNLAHVASQVAEAASASTDLLDGLVSQTADPQLLAALALTRRLVTGALAEDDIESASNALVDYAEDADIERDERPARWPRVVADLLFEEGFQQDQVR